MSETVLSALPHPSHHRSWIEVDLSAVAHNARTLLRRCGPRAGLTAVVKADAYGHGAVAVARAALEAGAGRLAVATCLEGQELRRAGVDAPVQILGATLPEEVEDAVGAGLVVSVHEPGIARLATLAAGRHGRTAVVHLKIDTGMGRLGVLPGDALAAAREIARLPGLRLEGLFTHFADPADGAYSRRQLAAFLDVAARLEEAGLGDADPALASRLSPGPSARPDARHGPRVTGRLIKHTASSGAALLHPDSRLDAIRPGCALYGFTGHAGLGRETGLRPAMAWRSTVAQIKDYPPGLSLGYNRTFTTTRPTRVAVLPVGYADGYPRSFGNRADVLIGGRRAALVGIVSMDYAMADITGLPEVRVGAVATLVGRDGGEAITLEELAERGDTIPYCIATGLGRRPGRGYVSPAAGTAGSGGA